MRRRRVSRPQHFVSFLAGRRGGLEASRGGRRWRGTQSSTTQHGGCVSVIHVTTAGQWGAGAVLLPLRGRACKFKIRPLGNGQLRALGWAGRGGGRTGVAGRLGLLVCCLGLGTALAGHSHHPMGTPGGAGSAGGGKEPGGFRGGSEPPPTTGGSGKFKYKRLLQPHAKPVEARATEGVVTLSPPVYRARKTAWRPRVT